MGGTADPLTNVFDLGADPMQFGKDRVLLAEELLKNLADKTGEKGESYQRTRTAFRVLLQQYGNGAHLVSNFVGGVHVQAGQVKIRSSRHDADRGGLAIGPVLDPIDRPLQHPAVLAKARP